MSATLGSHRSQWQLATHRTRLGALDCLVLAGMPATGPLPTMCVNTLFPLVFVPLLWAERDLVLKHHEVVAAYLAFANDCRFLLHSCCFCAVNDARERGSRSHC